MDINIKKTGYSRNALEVVVQHNGSELFFSPVITRGEQRRYDDDPESDANEYEIFHYLNLYIASLPAQTQANIFNCYQQINIQLNSADSVRELDRALRPLVNALMTNFDLNNIEHWMMLHSDVQIPTTLHESFLIDGRFQGTREKTYLKHDYIKLVSMVIGLKAMMPVWTSYIEATEEISGPTWKEHNAFKLISSTAYSDCEAMQRLRIYIEASIETPDGLASAIVEGISSVDFPEWLMAITVIRKILITDIRGIPRNKMVTSPVLMSAMHKYVTGKIKRYETNFVGTVRDKRPETNSGGDGESKVSVLENYKAREALSVGDITDIEVFFEDPVRDPFLYQTYVDGRTVPSKLTVIRNVLPTFMQAMVHFNQVNERTGSIPIIKQWQRTITELVLRDVLPARSLGILSRQHEFNCHAVAAAYLHCTGFKDIALILTSMDLNEHQDDRPDVEKVSKENVVLIEALYPHQIKGVKRNDKPRNAALVTIDLILRDIVECVRLYTLPHEMVTDVYPGHRRQQVVIKRDLRDRLAKLIIELK